MHSRVNRHQVAHVREAGRCRFCHIAPDISAKGDPAFLRCHAGSLLPRQGESHPAEKPALRDLFFRRKSE